MRRIINYFFASLFFCTGILKINAQDTICANKVDLAWLQANAPDRYQR